MVKEQDNEHISKLLEIMARLRDPGGGCVWDLEQTFATIAPYTLEEAYEVVDAIMRENLDDLRDELGDLLLQVVYHARMAEEAGAFDFGDVVAAICDKMIRRHPHVFGQDTAGPVEKVATGATAAMADAADSAATADSAGSVDPAGTVKPADIVDSAEAQTRVWETIKADERAAAAAGGAAATGAAATGAATMVGGEAATGAATVGALDGVPVALPALQRGTKLSIRAARVGFEWADTAAVREKLDEELAELDEAVAEGDQGGMRAEMGDTLFTLINLCRRLNLDPERCLREANNKFETRFRRLEELVRSQRGDWTDYDIEALELLWQEAKLAEQGG